MAGSRAGRERRWAARCWIGMRLGPWLRLLAAHRFAVHPCQWHTALLMGPLGLFHSAMRPLERLVFGKRIAQAKVEAPIFVIGHWRTGTTLLHELLILDERHRAPNTCECFAPDDFLISGPLFRRLKILVPSRRPMDNMDMGWDRPQEDEFALAIMGQPSPYHRIAFPNQEDSEPAAFDLEGLEPEVREGWKRALLDFLKRVQVARPGRMVLKSPTHSFRIQTLLELFPDARFVHIVRDPRVVFPSTVHLWRKLHAAQGLQTPTHEGLEEYVFRTFEHLYRKVEEGKALVDPSRFAEIRYEELVADPVGTMRVLYEHLGLGQFEQVQPRLDAYLAERSDYRTNRYEQSVEERTAVEARWGAVIRRYGYDQPVPEPAPAPTPRTLARAAS